MDHAAQKVNANVVDFPLKSQDTFEDRVLRRAFVIEELTLFARRQSALSKERRSSGFDPETDRHYRDQANKHFGFHGRMARDGRGPEGRSRAGAQALIAGYAQMYAADAGLDTKVAVYGLICSLGVCMYSAERIARLLCRHERSVRRALSELKRDGLIFDEANGAGRRMIPATPEIFGRFDDDLSWIVDAFAPELEQKRRGRPPKVKTTLSQASGEFGPSNIVQQFQPIEKYPDASVRGISEKYPDTRRQNTLTPGVTLTEGITEEVSLEIERGETPSASAPNDQSDNLFGEPWPDVHAEPMETPISPAAPKERSKSKSMKTCLDETAQLDATGLAYAVKSGWTQDRALWEFDNFKLYHLKVGRRFSRWDAAWEGWVRRGIGPPGGSATSFRNKPKKTSVTDWSNVRPAGTEG